MTDSDVSFRRLVAVSLTFLCLLPWIGMFVWFSGLIELPWLVRRSLLLSFLPLGVLGSVYGASRWFVGDRPTHDHGHFACYVIGTLDLVIGLTIAIYNT